MSLTFYTGLWVLPDGMQLEDKELTTFGVHVVYHGHYVRRSADDLGTVAWYSVESQERQLSRAGTWTFLPQKFQNWQHRFTFEEAEREALAHVKTIMLHGRTFAQWREERAC